MLKRVTSAHETKNMVVGSVRLRSQETGLRRQLGAFSLEAIGFILMPAPKRTSRCQAQKLSMWLWCQVHPITEGRHSQRLSKSFALWHL